LNAIRSAGIRSLKKTDNLKELERTSPSVEKRPGNKALLNPAPQILGPLSFQDEILHKKLSPMIERNFIQQAPQEASRPTFESQLFEKIRKRAQIVENQMGNDMKDTKSIDYIYSKENHVKPLLHKLKGNSNSKLISKPTISLDETVKTTLHDRELSKCTDSDNISLNSSKRSILGNSKCIHLKEVSCEMISTVLHDFHPNTDGQLGFNKGDKLIIINWNYSDGWAHVTVTFNNLNIFRLRMEIK